MSQCKKGHTIWSPHCKPCRDLKREWYERLERSGFQDEEKNGQLRVTAESYHILKDIQTQTQFEARRSYYQWAEIKLEQSAFSSEKDKKIWECHSKGMSRREISPLVGLEHSWISRKIKRIGEYLKTQGQMIASSMSCTMQVS